MPNAVGMLGAAICVSLLEGAWTWLLAAALSEVADQIPPSPIFMGSLLFVSWFSARALELRNVDLVVRRRILVGAGIAVALIAGTIHSGLVFPTQLVIGRPQPDLRGGGIVVLLLSAYLWGRGLALTRGIDRDRVGNHVGISAAGIIATLLMLPLTNAVQRDGMLVVACSFLLGVAALTFLQVAGTESRRLTPFQWATLIATTGIVLAGASAFIAGAFSLPGFEGLQRILSGLARAASPVTDTIFLAAGHLAEYLALLMRTLGEMFGADESIVRRAAERAESERPDIEQFDPGSPPELYVLIVAFSMSALALAIVITVYARLVGRNRARDTRISRQRERITGVGALGALRSAFGRLWHPGDREGPVPTDARDAIRHHYRRFQILMARADLARAPSQTPFEYEQSLQQPLRGAEDKLTAITNAYMLARYSPGDTRLPEPERIGEVVDELRTALQSPSAHPVEPSEPGPSPLESR